MFSFTRNPNYLGEMMVYGSFVLLVNDFISYVCIIKVWFVLFSLRMTLKEMSLMKKEGWEEYASRSWILVPKINGRLIDSIIFYGVLGYIGYTMYLNGGIKYTFENISKTY